MRSDLSRIAKFVREHTRAVIINEAYRAALPWYLGLLARFNAHIEAAFGEMALGGYAPGEAREIGTAPLEAEAGVDKAANGKLEGDCLPALSLPNDTSSDAVPSSSASLSHELETLFLAPIPQTRLARPRAGASPRLHRDLGLRRRARARPDLRGNLLAGRVAQHDEWRW